MFASTVLRPIAAHKLPWLLHTSGHSGFAKQKAMEGNSLMWFRKGLRIHDNPALEYACQNAKNVYPVFVLDPWFLERDPSAPSPGSTRVGINRIQFLLECLEDLDGSLRSRGSRLLLFKGNPIDVIPQLLKRWSIKKLCFEFDIEPYAQKRDNYVKEYASKLGVDVFCPISHTIFSPEEIIKKVRNYIHQQLGRKLNSPPLECFQCFKRDGVAVVLDLECQSHVPKQNALWTTPYEWILMIAHVEASKKCKERIATAYAKNKKTDGKLNKVELECIKQRSIDRENGDANKGPSKKPRQKKLTDYR